MEDRNFDGLYERLKKKIYNSPKGRLRLELLWQDLEPVAESREKMDILDAGGGFGQISRKLAEKGHDILLCDISGKMLEEAGNQIEMAGLEARVDLVHDAFQNITHKNPDRFDLVMSHAVMEWVADPEAAFHSLLSSVRPGGYLSLMFYNLHSLICQNMIKGNLYKVMNEAFSGDPNGLTPMNPIQAETVSGWLEDAGAELIVKTGIRVFYDLMPRDLRRERSYEDILAAEQKYCRSEPYASLGRYVHILAKKK